MKLDSIKVPVIPYGHISSSDAALRDSDDPANDLWEVIKDRWNIVQEVDEARGAGSGGHMIVLIM